MRGAESLACEVEQEAGLHTSSSPSASHSSDMLKLLLCLCLLLCNDIHPPNVLTNMGILRGKWMTSRAGNKYLAFLGVPYARPPIGQLRFKEPEEGERWEGVREATRPHQDCVQWNYLSREDLNTTGTEDCLYLNIYTPDTKYGALLPVLVYFHGGSFEFGEAFLNHGANYWMDERIVVVSVSSRLGLLGFLSFEDEVLPGNMGLIDQLLALRWIRQNIPAFGGHPKRITLMGEAAGGASVNFHLLSPRSRGLFQGGISVSGSAHAPWALVRSGLARERALRTAEAAGCLGNNTSAILDCLRDLHAHSLVDLRRSFIDAKRDPLTFYGPVVDSKAHKPFLPKLPRDLEQAGVPWLTGIASAEGLLKTETYTNIPEFSWKELDSNFSSYLRASLWANYPEAGNGSDEGEIRNAQDLRTYYFQKKPLAEDSFQNMTNLFTDCLFLSPMMEGVEKHPGPVYMYYFDYIGDYTFADIFGSRRVANGTCHGDAGLYLWEVGMFPPPAGDDLSYSRSMIKMWVNFAKYGSPTTRDSIINWPRYKKERRYLHMHRGGFTVRRELLQERSRFWSSNRSKKN